MRYDFGHRLCCDHERGAVGHRHLTRERFTLMVAGEGLGNGTVISTDGRINCGGGGACSASYDSGSRVILRARAGWLSAFDGWSGGGCSGTGDCVVTLGEDTMVTARFRLLGLF